MEFTIDRETFLAGIQTTLGIVEKNGTVPILQNILIGTTEGNDSIEIMASNREIGIKSDYKASINKPGQITVPVRKLNEIVKELEGDTVHFVIKGKRACMITCNKVVCKINGLDADDYPAMMDVSGFEYFDISPILLSELIGKVSYAVNKDDSRKNLSGMHMQKIISGDDEYIRAAATDGHRLAIMQVNRGPVSFLNGLTGKGVIIPRKGFTEILKILEDAEENVKIAFAKGSCIVEADNATLWVNLIDGDYPDIQRVIPAENAEGMLSLSVSRDAILHALRRMAVYGDGCSLDIHGGAIHFEASDPNIGEIKDEIEAVNLQDESDPVRVVKFNVRYLMESIESVSEEKVVLNIHEGNGACVVRGLEDANYTGIVMPLRG